MAPTILTTIDDDGSNVDDLAALGSSWGNCATFFQVDGDCASAAYAVETASNADVAEIESNTIDLASGRWLQAHGICHVVFGLPPEDVDSMFVFGLPPENVDSMVIVFLAAVRKCALLRTIKKRDWECIETCQSSVIILNVTFFKLFQLSSTLERTVSQMDISADGKLGHAASDQKARGSRKRKHDDIVSTTALKDGPFGAVAPKETCGTLMRRGQVCDELRSNARRTNDGTFYCPKCQASIAPDFYIDPFGQGTSQAGDGSEVVPLPHFMSSSSSSSNNADGEDNKAKRKKGGEHIADRQGHLSAAQTTIENCVRGMALPQEVATKAFQLFESLLLGRVRSDSNSDGKNEADKDPFMAHNAGPNTVVRRGTKVSGRKPALVLAIVETAALQNGTPRLHEDFFKFAGQDSKTIHNHLRRLRKAFPKQMYIDLATACKGFVRHLLSRMLLWNTESSARPEIDVMQLPRYEHDQDLVQVLALANTYVDLLCVAPPVATDKQTEAKSAMLEESGDDEDGTTAIKKSKAKKVRKNKEAQIAAACLLAASQPSERYRAFFSYADFHKRFQFLTKSMHDLFDILVARVKAAGNVPVPEYKRRSKPHVRKRRGVVGSALPPRSENTA